MKEKSVTVASENEYVDQNAILMSADPVVAGGNAGKILTKTLWNQSGNIYVPIDGEQVELEETYNQYCPYYITKEGNVSTSRSVTGCTNTAGSQILYYWLTRGYTFEFNITEDDYFSVKDLSKTGNEQNTQVNVKDADEKYKLTAYTEINNILNNTTDKLYYNSGDFIAALNYYCGVKNQSMYADSTGSWLYYGIDDYIAEYNGKMFSSLDFDSHYFIAIPNGSNNSRFFKPVEGEGDGDGDGDGYELTDLAYSLIRECLDYGEVLTVDIILPEGGHSIYLDGYQINKETGEYEYHLNFGWGPDSPDTKWYTVDELKEINVHVVGLDITPDISAHVSSTDDEYGAGTMQRALERINHTLNDTSAPITFDDSVKGKTSTQTTAFHITSEREGYEIALDAAVDVEFVEMDMNLVYTVDASAIQSNQAISFTDMSGNLILNSSTANSDYSLINCTGSKGMNITLDRGGMFAGSGLTSADGVISALEKFADNSNYSNLSAYEDNAISYVFHSGAGNDTIVLDNHSAVMGNISLGGGKNSITIDSGSVWFGNLYSAAELTLVLEHKASSGLIVTDALGDLIKNSPVITVNLDSVTDGAYILVDAKDAEGDFTALDLKLQQGDSVITINAGENTVTVLNDNQIKTEVSDGKLVLHYTVDTTPPVPPVVTADITELTNQDVHLTATFSDDSVVKEYSYDGKNWIAYTEAVLVEVNGIVYFRGKDAAGNISEVVSYEVKNIDKVKPEKPTVAADITDPTYDNVLLTAEFSSDSVLKQYSFDGLSWNVYEKPIAMSTNGIVYFRSQDEAGNYSEIVSYDVQNIYQIRETSSSPEHLSWEPIEGAEGYIVEYSVDNFKTVFRVVTTNESIASFALPAGDYQWRVKELEGNLFTPGADITSDHDSRDIQKYVAKEDECIDLFFANVYEKWGAGYGAQHHGVLGEWEGTNEYVSLKGKNKFADVFEGSNDDNILILTDDANGDALFVEDIFTDLPDSGKTFESRIGRINEIRAGAGDDIVDMTSQKIAYAGNSIRIYGGLGNDIIWAGNGRNTLFGDAGNDRIIGGTSDDVIIGGAGNDTLHGGGGNDIFCFEGNWGKDTVEQLSGDTITLWFAEGSVYNWNASKLTYSDGVNSVKVHGISADAVSLCFGSIDSAPAGAFQDEASDQIFGDKNNGMIA